MTPIAPLDREKLRHLVTDIATCRRELTRIAETSKESFCADRRCYAEAEHYFRRALEGILTGATHILSRLPLDTKDYAGVIKALGESGIITPEFARRNQGLAGYRNRLVHLYWEVAPAELYDTIKEHLLDLDGFVEAFTAVLRDPSHWRIAV